VSSTPRLRTDREFSLNRDLAAVSKLGRLAHEFDDVARHDVRLFELQEVPGIIDDGRLAAVRQDPLRPMRVSRCGATVVAAMQIDPYTGSNFAISQWSPIFSSVTRTLDAVSVGASWPTTTVWFTNTRTTA
jgi:hypothetical protein